MTGQVKEEMLTRLGELGVRVRNGQILLSPGLLPLSEVVPATFTMCSVPMTIGRGEADGVDVVRADGTDMARDSLELTPGESADLFTRSGTIARVEWTIGPPD